MRYRLLNPISSPFPSPSRGQMSLASPAPVRADSITRPFSKTQRTGLLSFSLMTTDTRSRLPSMVLVSTVSRMGLFRGMAFL